MAAGFFVPISAGEAVAGNQRDEEHSPSTRHEEVPLTDTTTVETVAEEEARLLADTEAADLRRDEIVVELISDGFSDAVRSVIDLVLDPKIIPVEVRAATLAKSLLRMVADLEDRRRQATGAELTKTLINFLATEREDMARAFDTSVAAKTGGTIEPARAAAMLREWGNAPWESGSPTADHVNEVLERSKGQ